LDYGNLKEYLKNRNKNKKSITEDIKIQKKQRKIWKDSIKWEIKEATDNLFDLKIYNEVYNNL
jgi:hypothetical protein